MTLARGLLALIVFAIGINESIATDNSQIDLETKGKHVPELTAILEVEKPSVATEHVQELGTEAPAPTDENVMLLVRYLSAQVAKDLRLKQTRDVINEILTEYSSAQAPQAEPIQEVAPRKPTLVINDGGNPALERATARNATYVRWASLKQQFLSCQLTLDTLCGVSTGQETHDRSEKLGNLLLRWQDTLTAPTTSDRQKRHTIGLIRETEAELRTVRRASNRLRVLEPELRKAENTLEEIYTYHIFDLSKGLLRMILDRTNFLDQLRVAQVCRLLRSVTEMVDIHPVHGPLLARHFRYVIRNAVDPICGKVLPLDRLADEFMLHTLEGRYRFVEAYGLPKPLSKEPAGCGDCSFCRIRKRQAGQFANIYDLEYRRTQRKIIEEDKQAKTEFILDPDLPCGHIPFEIGEFLNLTALIITNTKAKTIPPSFARLTHLQKLDMSQNQLVAFPVEFWTLTQLRSVNLEGNKLVSLPESLGNLTNLRVLNLCSNELEGLPSSIGRLALLSGDFNLGSNQLSDLPIEMVGLTRITGLNLMRNAFRTFPKAVCRMTRLEMLNLSACLHVDLVPDEICGLMNLKTLILSENPVERISIGITLLEKLRHLDIRKWRPEVLQRFDDEDLQLFLCWYNILKQKGCIIRKTKGFM